MKLIATVILLIGWLVMRPAAAGELEERDATNQQVKAAFWRQDFAELDAMAARFRRDKSRTSAGVRHLALFYPALAQAVELSAAKSEGGWTLVERQVERWITAFPNSPTAHIIYAEALIDHGFFIRGSGYARDVPPEAWAPFGRYLQRAYDHLMMHKVEASHCPGWYVAMLIIARAQGWDEERFGALLGEALTKEPDYYPTYYAAIEYLLPTWHGDLASIERLADAAVTLTRPTEGTALYARIYWHLSQEEFGDRLFTESRADWRKMRTSFDDVIKRYPDAWNVNNYARFACLARDQERTRELMARIGDAPLAKAWTPRELYRQCRTWAMSGRRDS
jgi:hypothetical protein